MAILLKYMRNLISLILILMVFSCGLYRKTDLREVPVNVDDRAAKNIAEGKSFKFGDVNKGSGTFEFASSNEIWRASISLLDFAPFSNVDYSGGIIITDWFADESAKNEYIKITVRFLSNEIRVDGINVIVHKKTCNEINICNVNKIKSTLSQEIKLAILKEAAILKEKELVIDEDYNPKTGSLKD